MMALKKRRQVAALPKRFAQNFSHVWISFRESFWSACEFLATLSRSAKNIAQFIFGAFEKTLSRLRQIFSRSIDVEIQHRHRRLKWCALASVTVFCGPFQGERDFAWIF